jgi:hypothetical protein
MSTKGDLDSRIRKVQEWLMADHMNGDIVDFCVNSWDVSRRQAYRYIGKAMEAFKESNEKSVDQKKNYYLARKRKLIHDMPDAYKKTPAGVAAINRVLDSMAQLEGLSIKKVELTGKDGKDLVPPSEPMRFENLTTEQIEQILGKHTE